MRVLLIKMSSLGDVVHALPAVTDAAARGITFDWVVEEAFASIPRAHPAVETVLPIAWRRWRRNLGRDGAELGAFLSSLRGESYDLILDAQGLVKSAAVTALGRGSARAGFNFTSAREPLAALAYDCRVTVPVGGHAVSRLRSLFAQALGYQEPTGLIDFGLKSQSDIRARECLLLHGTTWASKHWPESMWRQLAADLAADGWEVSLTWGNEEERVRANRLAQGLSRVTVLDGLSLAELGERIGRAGLVVGVDSGLTHLSGAMDRPTVVVYGATSAVRTGALGKRVVNLQSELHCAPCLSRRCRYRGESLRWQDEVVEPACYALLPPDKVRQEAMKLLESQG